MSSFSENVEVQSKIDTLKKRALQKESFDIYPFNPNFITDYKGYTLGMSAAEIDRLHTFRAENTYVTSKKEFQKVTGVSDSLLEVISPYFKFPEWSKKKKQASVEDENVPVQDKSFTLPYTQPKDLNLASAEELKEIHGVGDILSKRIVKFRDRLGGFLVDEQLYDVYNLEPDVVKVILRKYKVFNMPHVHKVNINTATAYELSSLVYLKYDVAKDIVSYRDKNGPFSSFNELLNIEGFPVNKIDRIALYLSL